MYLATTSDEGYQVPADRKQHQGRVEVDHVGWTTSKRKGMLKVWRTTAERVPELSALGTAKTKAVVVNLCLHACMHCYAWLSTQSCTGGSA